MNIWKSKDELAKHGRHGDTMMKKIDGDLAHVNAVEYEMSPESIKEIGSGTTNPITGKKEYFPWAVAATVGKAVIGGVSAMGNKADVEAGKAAAYDIYQEQLGLLGEKKDLTTGFAETQYTMGAKDVTTGTQIGTRDIQAGKDVAYSQSNLVTSGGIEEKVKTQTGDLMAKYKSDMTKLFESREFTKAEADLSYRSGAMSAESAYQDTLTGLESTPTTFLEGMFGS